MLAAPPGDGPAHQLMAGRRGPALGAVRHGDRGQPGQQRRGARSVLLGGDVQRDGAGLGGQRGQGVPAGPVSELGPVGGIRAAGARGAGVLEQVGERLDERLQVDNKVDGVQQRVGNRGLVRAAVEHRRQQPQPPRTLTGRCARLVVQVGRQRPQCPHGVVSGGGHLLIMSRRGDLQPAVGQRVG